MKTAIITDSSAYLSEEMKQKENVFVLDIPITIDGQTYIEGQNITVSEFYQKMQQHKNYLKQVSLLSMI